MHLLLGADSISDDYVRKALGLPPLRQFSDAPCDEVALTSRTEPDRLEALPPVVPVRRPLSHRAKKSLAGPPSPALHEEPCTSFSLSLWVPPRRRRNISKNLEILETLKFWKV